MELTEDLKENCLFFSRILVLLHYADDDKMREAAFREMVDDIKNGESRSLKEHYEIKRDAVERRILAEEENIQEERSRRDHLQNSFLEEIENGFENKSFYDFVVDLNRISIRETPNTNLKKDINGPGELLMGLRRSEDIGDFKDVARRAVEGVFERWEEQLDYRMDKVLERKEQFYNDAETIEEEFGFI